MKLHPIIWLAQIALKLAKMFPASRGLSRPGKMKREEKDLCRPLPASNEFPIMHALTFPYRNNQWRFCHVQSNAEKRSEFEREQERLLNLSARSNFKWTNQSWGWNNLASGRCTSLWGKTKRQILKQIFRSSGVFRWRIWSEIYRALWNCWFYCDSGLFFLRKQFVEWRLAAVDGVVSMLA